MVSVGQYASHMKQLWQPDWRAIRGTPSAPRSKTSVGHTVMQMSHAAHRWMLSAVNAPAMPRPVGIGAVRDRFRADVLRLPASGWRVARPFPAHVRTARRRGRQRCRTRWPRHPSAGRAEAALRQLRDARQQALVGRGRERRDDRPFGDRRFDVLVRYVGSGGTSAPAEPDAVTGPAGSSR